MLKIIIFIKALHAMNIKPGYLTMGREEKSYVRTHTAVRLKTKYYLIDNL